MIDDPYTTYLGYYCCLKYTKDYLIGDGRRDDIDHYRPSCKDHTEVLCYALALHDADEMGELKLNEEFIESYGNMNGDMKYWEDIIEMTINKKQLALGLTSEDEDLRNKAAGVLKIKQKIEKRLENDER